MFYSCTPFVLSILLSCPLLADSQAFPPGFEPLTLAPANNSAWRKRFQPRTRKIEASHCDPPKAQFLANRRFFCPGMPRIYFHSPGDPKKTRFSAPQMIPKPSQAFPSPDQKQSEDLRLFCGAGGARPTRQWRASQRSSGQAGFGAFSDVARRSRKTGTEIRTRVRRPKSFRV